MSNLQKEIYKKSDIESRCLFCQWVRDGKAVEAYGCVAAFRDGNPVTNGHLLVMPLRHTMDGLSMNNQEIHDSLFLIRTLCEKFSKGDPSITGFNIGMNIGESAGQTIFHAHIHLIPRRTGDCDNPKGGIRGVIDGKRCY